MAECKFVKKKKKLAAGDVTEIKGGHLVTVYFTVPKCH